MEGDSGPSGRCSRLSFYHSPLSKSRDFFSGMVACVILVNSVSIFTKWHAFELVTVALFIALAYE